MKFPIMKSMFLKYSNLSIVPKHDQLFLLRKNNMSSSLIYCHQQIGRNSIKTNTSGLISSVLTERSSKLSPSNIEESLIDSKGNLVLSTNGKSQAEITVKDLVLYSGPTTSNTSLINPIEEGLGIIKFLKGRSFFITGATGFLGKVLIEKILRTEPDVENIFLLIKAKNKEAATERLKNEIINTELFKRLQQIYGKSYQAFMMKKLIPIVGNICEPDLGIEQEIAQKIVKEIDIIVNSAASTTFDERYDIALDINTKGPGHLMDFAKMCKKIKLFLQVSTAYVNGQRQGRIMEKPFSIGESIAKENFLLAETSPSFLPFLSVENEIQLSMTSKEAFQSVSVAHQKMKELGLERAKTYGWQDTYVFTKAMGEMVINKMREEIPVVIIRPSVIESTCKDPFPGWMEGNRMMDPIVLYYGKGQLTGFPVDPNGVLDVVPADMVVNAILAAMTKHGVNKEESNINIYQIASSIVNPLSFQYLAKLLYEHYSASPCMDSNGRPICVPPMKLFNSFDEFSSHLWRDTIQKNGFSNLNSLNANKSRKLEMICRKAMEQAKYLANIYEPYTFYGGRFDNSNTQRLMDKMSGEEKREFGFDVGNIDWRDYITNVHIPGLRRHVMKGRGMCI